MTHVKHTLLPIFLAMSWISISEFIRNQFLFIDLWTDHYKRLGLEFPVQPINGAVWGIWASAFAVFIFMIAKKYSLLQTTMLSWLAGFVFMWLVIGNLGVLPFGILVYAIPLSVLEVYVAVWITKKLSVRTDEK